ncbi:MAG: bifunctional hydroxymethylpyrimidine kinase/phosphomethylpyrimidine kinase [Desulfobulbaceae bacterium]|nr:bifunctional hydroxymethylpyrimidine kinase/phosphomethylpyrimidine kinase [Desulfobulbaceae bacterium]
MATAEPHPPSVRAILSIAGSDPSGGAGIQADLKTFATLGVYGAAAITCLTVQNTTGVFATHPVAPEIIKAQVAMVLTDLEVSHIKLGMLGNSGIVQAVGEMLADFRGEVICDPILRASSGQTLLEEAALADFKREIIGRSTVLTPNFLEFQTLTGVTSAGNDEIIVAIAKMFAAYPHLTAIILKGGHRYENEPQVADTLFLREGEGFRTIESIRERQQTKNTHGTGCTFAAALAASQQKTGNWEEAFHLTCAYLEQLLRLSTACQIGHGTGPLLHHLLTDR